MKNSFSLTRITTFVLLAGTLFAWFTIYIDFSRFFTYGGGWFVFSGTMFPHPATTSCFYGGFAFLIGFIWSIRIWKIANMARRVRQWLLLTSFLIAGVIFAWTNAGLQIFKFYTAVPGEGVSCSGVPISNPFMTPCFIGASLFLASLILSIFVYRFLHQEIKGDRKEVERELSDTTGGTQ